MAEHIENVRWQSFVMRIILPTILTVVLFILAIYLFIVPTIERNSLDRKREMIQELTTSAWNILAKFEHDEQKGLITREQAQQQAIEQIKNLHYGQQMKDYFWINDMTPRMVLHPYRNELNGRDLTNYKDPEGKPVFIIMRDLVKQQGSGFVQYMWQWKDDETRVAPKISYIKGFEPWGWIIGTGIYIDDIKKDISAITKNVIHISLMIMAIMSLLLASIIIQHFKTEKRRSIAEKALIASEEKYRTLVESASEGMLMAIEGKYIYSNQTISKLLGYNQAEFGNLEIREIFSENPRHPGYQSIKDLIDGKIASERFEAQLKTKTGEIRDVLISTSEIFIDGKEGFIAVVTDITTRKQAEKALGASEEKFRTITNNLNVGVFRLSTGDRARFIEANPAMVSLFGFPDRETLLNHRVSELYLSEDDMKKIAVKSISGSLEREIVNFRRLDGSIFSAAIWATAGRKKDGTVIYFDGIIEDVTETVNREKQRDRQFSEMQSSLLFLNQQIETLPLEKITECNTETSVLEAAKIMNGSNTDVVIVMNSENRPAGVVTDGDIRRNVVGDMKVLDQPVSQIMSSPVFMLPSYSCIFEAGMMMGQNGISHVFISDRLGTVIGVLSSDSIIPLQKYSPAVLLKGLQNASTPEEMLAWKGSLPYIITNLINIGAKPQHINHVNTIVADTMMTKFINFALEELGPPPVKFAFLVFGSVARKEQTLKTDQDNAIVYEDVPHEEAGDVQKYFMSFGEKVCGWMDAAGYYFCEGDVMAKNVKWCQPLSVWKKYFTTWVTAGTAEDLLQTKIMFDFRCAYGERDYSDQLRNHLHELIAKTPRFFQLLARNVLLISPPLGFFGNFVTVPVGDSGKGFDIKSSMIPIVDYARIYALQHKMEETNTLDRLNELYSRNILSKQNYQEMIQAYSYLMQIRLRTQSEALSEGRTPNNYIRPQDLSFIEQRLLKEIFSQTKNFQVRLSYDFTGQLEG
jgi:PAS domain S-box-containing protein